MTPLGEACAVKILTPLPLRTRLKLRACHGIDVAGIWLCGHHLPGAAIWWWKTWRQW